MNLESEDEQSQIFQDRLGQWVSSQGFWFQLRHSLSGGVSNGSFLYHLFKLLSRIVIFGLIAVAGVWLFLSFKTGAESYRAELESSLKDSLDAETIELKSSNVSRGELYIGSLDAEGAKTAPYTNFELRGLKCDRVVLDQFRSNWDPGLIKISKLDIDLKAGADTEESATGFAEVYLHESEQVAVDAIDIVDTNISWGYSDRTRGSIRKSSLQAQRTPGGWRLRLRGGLFSQNWLKELQIVRMDAELTEEGLFIESAEFQKGDGKVIFKEIRLIAGQRPDLSGMVELKSVDLATIIPIKAADYLEGKITTTLTVSGSTNATEGVGFAGRVRLGDEDLVALRDEIPLLRALSVADAFNNYRRLEFRDGSFNMKTSGGRLKIDNINLKASDILTLKGKLSTRPPSLEELKLMRESGFSGGRNESGESDDESATTLRDMLANTGGSGKNLGILDDPAAVEFQRLGLNAEEDGDDASANDVVFLTNQYAGELEITLRANAFERAPNLAKEYPLDIQSGRVPMKLSLEGTIFDITKDTAEKIYRLGTR